MSEDKLTIHTNRGDVQVEPLKSWSPAEVESKRKALEDLLEAAKQMIALDSVGYNPAATKAQGSGYPAAIHAMKEAVRKLKDGAE